MFCSGLNHTIIFHYANSFRYWHFILFISSITWKSFNYICPLSLDKSHIFVLSCQCNLINAFPVKMWGPLETSSRWLERSWSSLWKVLRISCAHGDMFVNMLCKPVPNFPHDWCSPTTESYLWFSLCSCVYSWLLYGKSCLMLTLQPLY